MFDRPNPATAGTAVTYDEGLREHFRKVYNTMTLGLVFTGLIAFLCASTPAIMAMFAQPMFAIVVAFLPLVLGFVMFNGNTLANKSAADLRVRFYIFSGVFGLCLAPLVFMYSGANLARAFFVTAGTFAGVSAWSYTTKTDLSKFGSFLMMGVFGLILAMVVNIFLKSSMMDFVICAAGVLIYTGLTAYSTQELKETYQSSAGDEANSKMAIMGALSLYMNFIMLFQFILRLMGGNRE